MGYACLHSHVLPGLDDGAPDARTSDAMLRALHTAGYDLVCATPHQKASQFLPAAADIQAAFTALAATSPMPLVLGAENFWDEVLFTRWQAGQIPVYGKSRAFLFEIPLTEVPLRLEQTLFQMATRGLLPVMAHPERYVVPWDRLVALGNSIPLVVDLGALAGYHGAGPAKNAQRLVKENLAHAAATDVHSLADVRGALEGMAWIRKKLGPAAVTRLCDENPRRILLGELPER